MTHSEEVAQKGEMTHARDRKAGEYRIHLEWDARVSAGT